MDFWLFKRTSKFPCNRRGFQYNLWTRTILNKEFLFNDQLEAEVQQMDLLNWTAHIFSQSVDDTWETMVGKGFLSQKQIGAVGTFLPNELINLINQGRKFSTFIGALMFADISGFTTLCETYAKFGPEGAFRLTAMLNSYIGAMVDLIYSFGGDLLKFAGDAFLAVWHVRLNEFMSYKVHEAISCAMHIQYSLGTYITDVGVMLKVKIAVSAGNFVFSLVGDEQNSSYLIYGFPVLEAKKAESMAESGDTIVAPSAWRLVSARDYSWEPMAEGYAKMKRILYDPRVMTRQVFDFDARQLVEINIKNETLRNLTEKTDLNSSTMSFEENIRSNLFGTAIHAINEELRPFVIAPVMQQIDANSSFEYLTEMRQVTIMFITLKPNTNKESGIIKLTDVVYCSISKIVKSKLGLINKVCLFDKDIMFLVIFGMKGFKEKDEALRCLRCAYQIHSTLATDEMIKSMSIGVTIGNTYCGVVGHPFRKEYTVIGGAVNKAARLMCAYTNVISCDLSVVLNSRLPLAYFTRLPPRYLKGIAQATTVFKYDEVGLDPTKIPPLLGRQDIIKKFKEILRGKTPFKGILIMGDPRSGKTRVLNEFVEVADKEGWKTIWVSVHSNLRQGFCLIHKLFANLLGRSVKHRMATLITLFAEDKYYKFLYVLNDILDVNFAFPFQYQTPEHVTSKFLFRRTLMLMAVKTVILIDDAHGLDPESLSCCINIMENNPFFVFALTLPMTWMKRQNLQVWRKSRLVISFFLEAMHVTFVPAIVCQMLNVEAVPRKLIKVLVKLSRGNPGWVQTFLLSYIEAGIIMIKSATVSSLNTSIYIMPEKNLIYQVEASEEPPDDDTVIQVCKIVKSLDENALPATFDDVIMSMFDRLSSFEQLLLKCASVLGNSFLREDLIKVMGDPPETHVAPAIRRLFQLHVLGCSLKHLSAEGDEDTTDSNDKHLCHCTEDYSDSYSGLPYYASCKNPVFRFSVFCTTINATIPMNQKIEFHTRAMVSIKTRSQKCQYCSSNEEEYNATSVQSSIAEPYVGTAPRMSFIKRKPREMDGDTTGFFDDDNDEPFNPFWDDDTASRDYYQREKTIGTVIVELWKKVFSKKKKKKPLNLFELPFPSVVKCDCFKDLSEIYTQLVHHSRMAELLVLELKYLIAFALLSISYGKYDKAVMLLKDAEHAHEKCLTLLNTQDATHSQDKSKIEKKKKAISMRYMKYTKKQIYTYLGVSYLNLGRISHAYTHLDAMPHKAIFPPYFYFELVLMNWPEVKLTYRKKLRRKMVIKTDVYLGLAKLFLMQRENKKALKMANRAAVCARTTDDVRHRSLAFGLAIELNARLGHFKTSRKMEKRSLKRVRAIYKETNVMDVVCVGHVYCAVFKSRYFSGDFKGCIEVGTVALNIAQTVSAADAQVYILSKLCHALYTTKNIEDLQVVLHPDMYMKEELNSYSHVIKMKAYHRLVLDVFMEAGLALENPNQMLLATKKTLNRKHITVEYTLSRHAVANIWLWYLRRREYKRARTWAISDFSAQDVDQENIFYCVKIVQCQLLWLESKLDDTPVTHPKLRFFVVFLKQIFKTLKKKCIKRCPNMLARYYHLKAYFAVLTFQVVKAKSFQYLPGYKLLLRGYRRAEQDGNMLEKAWITHSKALWYSHKKVQDPEFWSKHIDEEAVSLDGFENFDWSEILFSLRVPKRVEENVRRLLSFVSLPDSFSSDSMTIASASVSEK